MKTQIEKEAILIHTTRLSMTRAGMMKLISLMASYGDEDTVTVDVRTWKAADDWHANITVNNSGFNSFEVLDTAATIEWEEQA